MLAAATGLSVRSYQLYYWLLQPSPLWNSCMKVSLAYSRRLTILKLDSNWTQIDDEAKILSNTSTSASVLSASVMTSNGNIQGQATLPDPSSATDQVLNDRNSEDSHHAQTGIAAGSRVETLQIADNLSNSSLDGLRDEPDFDFYIEASWFVWIVKYTLCSVCVVSLCVVGYTATGTQMAQWVLYPVPWLWWTWSFFSIPATFWCFTLSVISVEDIKLKIRESRARDLSFDAASNVLILYFLFQLIVYGVGLPSVQPFVLVELLPTNPMTWLYMVVPVELYLFVAGFRAWTVHGLLCALSLGLLFAAIMAWPLIIALMHWGLNGQRI